MGDAEVSESQERGFRITFEWDTGFDFKNE